MICRRWNTAATYVTVKVVIYERFVEGKLEAPWHWLGTSNEVTTTPCPRGKGDGVSTLQERDREAWRRMHTTLTTKRCRTVQSENSSDSLGSGQRAHLQAHIDIVSVRVDPTISGHIPHFVR